MKLTYAAPFVRDVALHDGPVGHDAPAKRVQAAAVLGGGVVVAHDVPKLDLAGIIPPVDLPTVNKSRGKQRPVHTLLRVERAHVNP